MLNEKDLLDLKNKIDTAKTEISELKGQLSILMKQLKDNWNCTTIEEATVKLKELDGSIEVLDKKIVKAVQDLEVKIQVNP